MKALCDECRKSYENPYRLLKFQGRQPVLCGECLTRIVRGIGQADRAARKWLAT